MVIWGHPCECYNRDGKVWWDSLSLFFKPSGFAFWGLSGYFLYLFLFPLSETSCHLLPLGNTFFASDFNQYPCVQNFENWVSSELSILWEDPPGFPVGKVKLFSLPSLCEIFWLCESSFWLSSYHSDSWGYQISDHWLNEVALCSFSLFSALNF